MRTDIDVPSLLSLARERATLGTAAELVGCARRMLDMTVQYAKDREQFGKPIGAQQAVKHRLADALIAQEFARPLVYKAAWSLQTSAPELEVDVSMAKIYAGEAARFVAKQALQVHGAIGYTIECDLHMWMKRAWALAAAHGDTAHHRERVGRHAAKRTHSHLASVRKRKRSPVCRDRCESGHRSGDGGRSAGARQ